MAITQQFQSGVARTLEIGDADGDTGMVNIGGETGRELVSFTYGVSRPSNPTSTNSTARGTEQATTLEVTFTFEGTRTATSAPVLDALMEPTLQYFRVSTRNKASGVAYIGVRGIPMLTYTWEAAGVQAFSVEVAVDAEPTEGSYP